MFRVIKRAPWILIGAAGAWLFDGERGAARREALRARAGRLLDSSRAAPPVVEPSTDSVRAA